MDTYILFAILAIVVVLIVAANQDVKEGFWGGYGHGCGYGGYGRYGYGGYGGYGYGRGYGYGYSPWSYMYPMNWWPSIWY